MIERIPITSRKAWLELRGQDVTASVAGALLGPGVHDYQTAFGLWALKTSRVLEDPEETPAMQRGRLLEPVALQLLRERHPDWEIENPGIYLRDPEARIGATPDAFARHPERGLGIVQIKTVEPSIYRRKWLPEGNGAEAEPPLWIAVQAIIEATLAGAKWAMVTPLVVSYGLDMPEIEIPIHAGVYDRVKAEVAQFWKMVDTDSAPEPDYGRDSGIIGSMYPDANGQEIDLSADNMLPELLEERARLKQDAKEHEARIKAIDAEIAHKMGPHERAYLPGWRLSRPTVFRKAYSVAASSYRRLTVKPAA